MAATGASPTYFNFDNFEEIQVSTAGQDIKQPTGGIGLNLVVKRGTNQFQRRVPRLLHDERIESSNVPDELKRRGRHARTTADHNKQISDYGFDIGGPILRDQRVVLRLVLDSGRAPRAPRRRARRSHELKNPNVKLNWQATKKDMVSFLYFDGFKVKDGRSPGVPASCSTRRRRRSTRTTRTPTPRSTACGRSPTIATIGLEPVPVGEVRATTTPASCSIPIGGLDQQAGRNFVDRAVVRLGQPEPERAAAEDRQRRLHSRS